MKKKTFYTELSYIIGTFSIALATALMTTANFGISMVVAPAYLIHLKLVEYFSFFSFGMAEYCLQGLILLLMMLILRKVKLSYFFSFVTAVLYGFMLDFCLWAISFTPSHIIYLRIAYYIFGMLLCSFGVAMSFKTYISPEAYELFVKEISGNFNISVGKFKTAYDCVSCIVGIALSFAFFGFGVFKGVWIGTIICALVNGTIIGLFSKALDKKFEFKDGLKLRKFFEK